MTPGVTKLVILLTFAIVSLAGSVTVTFDKTLATTLGLLVSRSSEWYFCVLINLVNS